MVDEVKCVKEGWHHELVPLSSNLLNSRELE